MTREASSDKLHTAIVHDVDRLCRAVDQLLHLPELGTGAEPADELHRVACRVFRQVAAPEAERSDGMTRAIEALGTAYQEADAALVTRKDAWRVEIAWRNVETTFADLRSDVREP